MSRRKLPLITLCLLLCSATFALGLPVQAQPTNFGYAVIGNSNASTFGGVFVSNFTSPANIGEITEIQAYLATGGTSAKAVIYADSNGQPSNLLAESASVSIEGTSGKWVTFPVSYTGAANVVYWLGVVIENAGTYYYNTLATEQAIYEANLTDALDPFPVGSNVTKGIQLSIVATYTPTANPPADQTPTLASHLIWVVIVGVIVAATVAVLMVVRSKKNNKT